MGVKDLLAKQDSGFISFHELITRLMSLDNASYQQTALCLHRLLNNPQSEYVPPDFSSYTLLNGVTDLDLFEARSAMNCLAQAATEGEAKDSYSWGETNKFSPSDFNRFGFIEADISEYLSNHGLSLPVIMFQVKPIAISQELGWRDTLSLSPTLTDREVICVLSGIDPFQNGYLDDASSADYSRWEAVVHRSIRSGDLVADDNAWDIHGVVTEWVIKPESLFSWCHQKKVTYPLNTEMVYVGRNVIDDDEIKTDSANCQEKDIEISKLHEELDRLRALLSKEADVDDLSLDLAAETERASRLEVQLLTHYTEHQSAMNLKAKEISDLKAELDSLKALLSKEIKSGLPTESTSDRRIKQIRVIAVLAQSIFPDPMSIPDGGKSKIKEICIGIPGLFTPQSFDTPWNEARDNGFVRMEKHNTYAGG